MVNGVGTYFCFSNPFFGFSKIVESWEGAEGAFSFDQNKVPKNKYCVIVITCDQGWTDEF